jgi:Rhodopirellula transposase DDE domain
MSLTPEVVGLIRQTADGFPRGPKRRAFMAQTVHRLGLGQRGAARLLGWAREALVKARRERVSGLVCVDDTSRRGRKPAEHRLPRLLEDIKAVVADHVQTDPTFQTRRLYCRLSAAQVRRQLIAAKGYTDEQLPSLQTITTKLNALGFRLAKVGKTRPKKDQGDGRHLRRARKPA